MFRTGDLRACPNWRMISKPTIGIIGFTENVDIKPVLEANLAGLEVLKKKLK